MPDNATVFCWRGSTWQHAETAEATARIAHTRSPAVLEFEGIKLNGRLRGVNRSSSMRPSDRPTFGFVVIRLNVRHCPFCIVLMDLHRERRPFQGESSADFRAGSGQF